VVFSGDIVAAEEVRILLSVVDDDDPSALSRWEQALIRMQCGVDEPPPKLHARLAILRNSPATRSTVRR
jgi:hypothetical protein